MNARRQTAGYALCLALAAGLASGACVRPHPDTTPASAHLQRANQVVQALDLVVDSTIAARDIGWVTPATARTVLLAIQAALPAIHASPDGAKVTALAALLSVKNLPDAAKLLPYVRWAEATIGAIP